MTGPIIIAYLIAWIFGSLLSAIILNILAKYVGKIEGSTYGKSLLVALSSSIIVMILYAIISAIIMENPMEFLMMFADFGLLSSFVLNIVIFAVAYIPMGKFIWKGTWIQSLKANSVWIILYAIFAIIAYAKINSMISDYM